MNKTLKILLAVFFVIIIVFSCFALIENEKSKIPFDFDESLVSNSFNNAYMSGGDLAAVNGYLCFNYKAHNTDFTGLLNYGLYKIGGKGKSRIYWEGPNLWPYECLYTLQVYKDNLLFDEYYLYGDNTYTASGFNGNIYHINTDTGSIELFSTIKDAKKNKYEYYRAIDDKIYVFSKDKIYLSTDCENVEVIFDKLSDIKLEDAYVKDCYIYGNTLTYITRDGYVQMYDYVDKKILFNELFDLKDINAEYYYDIQNIVVCKDKIFFTVCTDNGFEIYNVSDGFKKIYTQLDISDYYCYKFTNCYDKYILVSSETGGIDLINTETEKITNIVKFGTDDVYVVGDKWIYYVDYKNNLHRVTYDGKIDEKIF
ncbi:MAG: hypothetical protein K6F76_05785 [Clostridiales bacterium]|nr:hypothetical protein [Clostridiales bacterium]